MPELQDLGLRVLRLLILIFIDLVLAINARFGGPSAELEKRGENHGKSLLVNVSSIGLDFDWLVRSWNLSFLLPIAASF